LIACANAAALLLARTTDRAGEMAVRVALGAGRARLARQIVTESVTLATIAAVGGAIMAGLAFRAIVASLPVGQAMGDTLTLGWQGFGLAFVLALLVGLGVSIVPVRRVLNRTVELRARGEEGLRRGTSRAHGWLIAGQVTLAMMLVVAATLLIRSVERIRQLDTGFDAKGLVALDLVGASDSAFRATQDQFYSAVLERVQALPGVVSAGMTNRLPIRDGGWQGSIVIEGREDLTGPNRPNSLYRSTTPDFLRTMGVEIREGRGFDATDRVGSPQVAIVSEGFAKRMWPGESAVGKRMAFGSADNGWRTIVGVAEETRMTSVLGEIPLTTWIPREQNPQVGGGLVLVIRATTDLDGVIAAARSIVMQENQSVAVGRMETMEAVLDRALAEPLRLRFFLGLFAALALALGSVGVFGVVSYSVARRRAEFGIRMALGAGPRRVLAEVVRTGMLPVTLGVVAGVAGSVALSGVIRSFLYEVSPMDPSTLTAAAAVLLTAGALAALVPGWRARGVSPVEALKSD
jgi:predicted permease